MLCIHLNLSFSSRLCAFVVNIPHDQRRRSDLQRAGESAGAAQARGGGARLDRRFVGAGLRQRRQSGRISDLPTGPDAGIFGLMDRRVVDEFNKLPERNRFIPGLRSWLGFKQGTVQYDRADRAAGKPKQTLRRLVRYAMDGMISFSYKP